MPKIREKTVNVGIDVGKTMLDVVIHARGLHFNAANDAAGIRYIIGRLSRYAVQRVVVEATGRRELQGHERMTAGRTIGYLLLLTPLACKSGDPVVGTGVTQLHQITMKLPNGTSLFAMTLRLSEQPVGQGLLVIIQLGWVLAFWVTRVHYTAGQVLMDRIAGQFGSSRNLSYWHPFAEMPSSNHT